jgi:NTP pyrophosphatase (non-canonical NTP hydrolase)
MNKDNYFPDVSIFHDDQRMTTAAQQIAKMATAKLSKGGNPSKKGIRDFTDPIALAEWLVSEATELLEEVTVLQAGIIHQDSVIDSETEGQALLFQCMIMRRVQDEMGDVHNVSCQLIDTLNQRMEQQANLIQCRSDMSAAFNLIGRRSGVTT